MQTTQHNPRKYAGQKMKKLVKVNPCREGSQRAMIVDAAFKAKTVDEFFATPLKVGRKTMYPSAADLVFLEKSSIIDL